MDEDSFAYDDIKAVGVQRVIRNLLQACLVA
jgi:hypothetical protein